MSPKPVTRHGYRCHHICHAQGRHRPTNMEVSKELNSNLKATLKTKHGNTCKSNIKDSIRQGGVLSVIQYALLMDDINKEIIKEDIGPKIDCTKEPIGCLLWMDDVALISNDPNELQKMLNIINEVANRYQHRIWIS